MNVTEYDNKTHDYNNILSINFKSKNNKNNIDLIIPTFSLTISCGLSFLCLKKLMAYTSIKPSFNNI